MEHVLSLNSKLETSSRETESTKAEDIGEERHFSEGLVQLVTASKTCVACLHGRLQATSTISPISN